MHPPPAAQSSQYSNGQAPETGTETPTADPASRRHTTRVLYLESNVRWRWLYARSRTALMRMKPCVARVGEGWDSIVTVREPDHTHQTINSNTQTYLGVVGVVVEGRAAALDLHGGQVR